MSRVLPGVALVLVSIGGVGLYVSSCLEESGPPGPELFDLRPVPPPNADTVRDGRAQIGRIVSDARSGSAAELGGDPVLARVPAARGGYVLHTAFGLDTGEEQASAEPRTFVSGVVELRVLLAGREVYGAQIAAAEALEAWHEVRLGFEAQGGEELEFFASGPELPVGMRALWAQPTIVPQANPSAAQQPDVILISVDTLRADHLGAWGYERNTSPNIDALALGGIVFEDARSTSSWTLPSYASLFTGLYPTEHRAGVVTDRDRVWGEGEGTENTDAERMRDDVPTLAELFRDGGWRTAGFHSNPYLDHRRGLARGFERWVHYESAAHEGVDRALEWLAKDRETPAFLFLHLMDPHAPYTPPAPWDHEFSNRHLKDLLPRFPPAIQQIRKYPPKEHVRKLLVDLYDGEIAYTDNQLGRLFKWLDAQGRRDRTLVVFHSDHGEEFWEHGGFEHGHTLYDEVVHVPLVFAWPGVLPAGTRLDQNVSCVDVLPTLAGLVGLTAAPSRGRDLSPLWSGTADDPLLGRPCLVAEGILHGDYELKAAVGVDTKLILGGPLPGEEFFDLVRDPGEQNNLAGGDKRLGTLLDSLKQFVIEMRTSGAEGGLLEFSEDEKQRLSELGYTAGETWEEEPEEDR